jgi:hypothetical protein
MGQGVARRRSILRAPRDQEGASKTSDRLSGTQHIALVRHIQKVPPITEQLPVTIHHTQIIGDDLAHMMPALIAASGKRAAR